MMSGANPTPVHPAAEPPRREGFPGQHLVVLPSPIVRRMRADPLLTDLFPVAAGFFPRAPGHLVERERGLDDHVLIRVLAGAGWVRTESRQDLRAGDWLLIPAGRAHGYGAEPDDPWSIQWVHFQGRAAAAFAALLGAGQDAVCLPVPARATDTLDLADLTERLAAGYTQANLLASAARLRVVLTGLDEARRTARPSSAAEAVRASEAWMRAHLAANIDLAGLARAAGLSVPHYSDLFRRQTGYPPKDHFLRLKIQRACQLLDTTDLRVVEVAASLGWEDAFYFSRCFRKITGKSPRAYRAVVKS
jgi:AraC-like DNA-binding protein